MTLHRRTRVVREAVFPGGVLLLLLVPTPILQAQSFSIQSLCLMGCSYVHDAHTGLAARKRAECDGTHPGIRRKRENRSNAR